MRPKKTNGFILGLLPKYIVLLQAIGMVENKSPRFEYTITPPLSSINNKFIRLEKERLKRKSKK